MIEYKAAVPKEIIIDWKAVKSGTLKLGNCGYCRNENLIYLIGHNTDIDKWIYVLIHEEFHSLFFKFGINSKYHHNIINLLEEEFWELKNEDMKKKSDLTI